MIRGTGIVTTRIIGILERFPKGTTATNVSLLMAHPYKSVKSTIRRLMVEGYICHGGYLRHRRGRVAMYRVPRPDEAEEIRAAAADRAAKPLTKRNEDFDFRETDKAAAKLAELMGPHRYEDAPHKPEGRLQVASPLGLQSYTGCAAQMCLS